MNNLTLTPRMIRDVLAIQGAQSLRELSSNLKTSSNEIQAMLIELASAGEVSYNYENGTWFSEVVL
jgi:Mn-dependent DtxR family transcriptional regulator